MSKVKKEKKIFLHHHLGLGDHIICNGLVNVLSKKYSILLIVKYKNYSSVRHLYKESKKVRVIPLLSFLTKTIHRERRVTLKLGKVFNRNVLFVGFQKNSTLINWDKNFYDQVNIPFKERYQEFYVPKYKKVINVPENDFRLIHSKSSTGEYNLKIKNADIQNIFVTKSKNRNIFAYTKLIEEATEIHCIDSAFIHLVDSYDLKNTKLFYHNIRKADVYFTFNNSWEVVNYD